MGAETRIGFTSKANKSIHIRVTLRVLELILEDVKEQSHNVAKEMLKVGAAMVCAQAGSLRGPEVFMMDLGGLIKHLHLGKHKVMPKKTLNRGTDLFNAPHVHLTMVGKFKGENGIREHLVSVASESLSGLKIRWLIDQLLEIRDSEGCTSGPAFRDMNERLASMTAYNDILNYFLKKVQLGSHFGFG